MTWQMDELEEKLARLEVLRFEAKVNTWSDGRGLWHAAVAEGLVAPMLVARLAIYDELHRRYDVTMPYVRDVVTRLDPDHHYSVEWAKCGMIVYAERPSEEEEG